MSTIRFAALGLALAGLVACNTMQKSSTSATSSGRAASSQTSTNDHPQHDDGEAQRHATLRRA